VKRRIGIITVALTTLTVLAAVPAWAYWGLTSGNAFGFSAALTVGVPTVSSSRLLGIVTVTVTAAPASGATGYTVTDNGSQVCTISGATGSCSSGLLKYLGSEQFLITAALGSWIAPTSRTCSYGNDVLGTGTASCS
jgi:hypothetical protein